MSDNPNLIQDPLLQRPLFGFEEFEDPTRRKHAVVLALEGCGADSLLTFDVIDYLMEQLLLDAPTVQALYDNLLLETYTAVGNLLRDKEFNKTNLHFPNDAMFQKVADNTGISFNLVKELNEIQRLKVVSSDAFKEF
ncbi:MAG: hypothetical protein ABIM99_04580 [Candidatus Dojkabacteria bacterium]